MEIKVLPYNKDNYSYLILSPEHKTSVLVDAGSDDIIPMWQAVAEEYKPSAILLTHSHWDHVDGLEAIHRQFPCPVFAHENFGIKVPNFSPLKHEQSFTAGGMQFQAYESLFHHTDHLAFLAPGHVFSGDILFAAGCGRFFAGDASMLLDFIQKMETLPDETKIWFGHEYTPTNLRFTLSVEPGNEAVKKMLKETEGKITTPSTIGNEKRISAFFRFREEGVKQAVGKTLNEVESLTKIRELRNNFS